MVKLFLQSLFHLVQFDLCLLRRDFRLLEARVRACPTLAPKNAREETAVAVCYAIDLACICYWKQVLCLQRSAATTCMLRRHGVPARLVIGAQQLPFRAHAWVEVEGHIVNDRTDMEQIYSVLDRY